MSSARLEDLKHKAKRFFSRLAHPWQLLDHGSPHFVINYATLQTIEDLDSAQPRAQQASHLDGAVVYDFAYTNGAAPSHADSETNQHVDSPSAPQEAQLEASSSQRDIQSPPLMHILPSYGEITPPRWRSLSNGQRDLQETDALDSKADDRVQDRPGRCLTRRLRDSITSSVRKAGISISGAETAADELDLARSRR